MKNGVAVRRGVWGALLAAVCLTPAVSGQELADFDYENLSFRGFAPEWGYIWPTRVEATNTWGLRMDLGYLGPGVRIVPSISYWKSPFKAAEVRELEDRVASLIVDQTDGPAPQVDLGVIDWSDVSFTVDAQVVWSVPYDILTFLGLGVGTHLLNGSGAAIDGTFVEDLLDSVTAGINLHAGMEYPLNDRFRVYGQGRYEILGDLRYTQLRFGAQIMTGAPAAGEERSR